MEEFFVGITDTTTNCVRPVCVVLLGTTLVLYPDILLVDLENVNVPWRDIFNE